MPIPQVNDRIKEAPVVVLRAVFAGIGQLLLTADKVRARAAEQVWTPDRATAPAGQPQYPVPQQPRNGTLHAEPATASHSAMREAAAGPGTATAAAPAVAPAAKAGSGLVGAVPHPAPGADREKVAPGAKATPGTKATPAAKTAKAAPVARSTADAKSAAGAKVAKSTPDAKAAGPNAAGPRAAGTTTAGPRAAGAKAAGPRAAGAKSTKTTPAVKPGRTAKTKAVPAPRAGKAGPATEAPPLPGYDDISLASLRARLRALDPTAIRAMLAYERAHARREPVITMLERRLTKITSG